MDVCKLICHACRMARSETLQHQTLPLIIFGQLRATFNCRDFNLEGMSVIPFEPEQLVCVLFVSRDTGSCTKDVTELGEHVSVTVLVSTNEELN